MRYKWVEGHRIDTNQNKAASEIVGLLASLSTTPNGSRAEHISRSLNTGFQSRVCKFVFGFYCLAFVFSIVIN